MLIQILSGDCGLPKGVVGVIGNIYQTIMVLIPVFAVLFSVIDFLKGASAGKEDGIKQNTGLMIKRILYALLAFFIFAIVKWVLGLLATDNTTSAISCLSGLTGN